MKHWVFVMSIVVFVSMAVSPACASDQPRALKRRATTVLRQKNDFVSRVLHSYEVAYQTNQEGIVTKIQMGGNWHDVNRIEIVPLVREREGGLEVVGHEIFFFTEDEILHLVSALTIR